MPNEEPSVRYDEKWHRRVDRTLFGHVDDESGVWVDGVLQYLADSRASSRKFETIVTRVGLPILIVIAIGVVITAMHQPPELFKNILILFGIR